ncbi:hypothetical protein VTN02DRAFT_4496 [Thermoascus thermophilus]
MTDLRALASRLVSQGPHRILPTPRRIRIRFGDAIIVDTTAAVYVWEHEYYPQFYVPLKGLQSCQWEEKERLEGGGAAILTVKVGEKETDRVLAFLEGKEAAGQLAGLVRVELNAVDQYYEEDDPIYVHPRDPFKRIDVLHAVRPVTVSLEGILLASAAASYHLYETLLPCRYYLPPTAIVDWSLLQPSHTRTRCPYKGEAQYYDVVLPGGKVYKDIVWYYATPLREAAPVTGCLCFYNEQVDIELDGVLLERPKTKFG